MYVGGQKESPLVLGLNDQFVQSVGTLNNQLKFRLLYCFENLDLSLFDYFLGKSLHVTARE